jgi:hypothetical protein
MSISFGFSPNPNGLSQLVRLSWKPIGIRRVYSHRSLLLILPINGVYGEFIC